MFPRVKCFIVLLFGCYAPVYAFTAFHSLHLQRYELFSHFQQNAEKRRVFHNVSAMVCAVAHMAYVIRYVAVQFID